MERERVIKRGRRREEDVEERGTEGEREREGRKREEDGERGREG